MRILLLRTSALGDVIHCLPVLTALRRDLPESTIGWVVERAMAPVLEDHPDIDELFVVRMREWRHRLRARRTWREILEVRRRLRCFRADVVFDLMGNHKAGALARLSGCHRRVGLRRQDRREPSSALWINEPVPALGRHAVERALSLLPAVGIEADFAGADFAGGKLFQQPSAEADRLTAAGEVYALLSPGAGWENKRYPSRLWGQAARQIHETSGIPIWVTCGPGEEGLAEELVAAGGDAARLLGPTDLPTLAWLMRRSRLFLGGDTGPLHLAHALGTPVLSLMGPTDPSTHGPFGNPDRALVRRLPCSFCHQRMDEPKACMMALPPLKVAARAVEILNAHGHLAIH
ncbi:MAG: glycosyltransferase family 9 protein [Acidobacteria bacterium]|nr:glycosyltransferase family 9 protein [Acidobacteriota bacterium]